MERKSINETHNGIHLSHDCHTEFVDPAMNSSEHSGRWIVTISFVDLSDFEDNWFGSIGFHGKHLLEMSDKSDDRNRIFRSTNNA